MAFDVRNIYMVNSIPLKIYPSIAQLVERRTVVGKITGILRSLVRLRFEGDFLTFFQIHVFPLF
jgi:hypothetical protein